MTKKEDDVNAKAITAALLAASLGAAADVTTVSGLVEAVNNAAGGEEIVVAAGTYNLAEVDPQDNAYMYTKKNITLRGATGNPADVVINGDGKNRILYLDSTGNSSVIRDITFQNGCCTNYTRNTSSGKTYEQNRGGAITFLRTTTAVISNCVFRRNSAVRGGAVGTYYDISTAESAYRHCGIFMDCVFEENLADVKASAAYGGALYMPYKCERCHFTNNTARTAATTSYGAFGGAVVSAGEIVDCDFSGNRVEVNASSSSVRGGGALYMAPDYRRSGLVSGCRFECNEAALSRGGAMACAGGFGQDCVVTNCTFLCNTGGVSSANYHFGGALYCCSNVVDCVLSSNVCYNGGAVAYSSLKGCALEGNVALMIGGGAYRSALEGCSLERNMADKAGVSNCNGGGAYDSSLRGCLVGGNYAGNGGGVHMCELSFCTNVANETKYHGENYPAEMYGSTARDCVFRGMGGVPAISSEEPENWFLFSKSSFERCRFLDGKGGAVFFAGTVALTNCLVANCSVGTALFRVNTKAGDFSDVASCTFVSNSYARFRADATVAEKMAVANTLFFGGKENGNERDFSGDAAKLVSSFDNSIFASSGEVAANESSVNYYGNSGFTPKFAGADADAGHPYALRYGSPARRAGAVQAWMAGATDLRGEGFPRLRDGAVDIGCYECWLHPAGMNITVR